jgi:hypothetical protein
MTLGNKHRNRAVFYCKDGWPYRAVFYRKDGWPYRSHLASMNCLEKQNDTQYRAFHNVLRDYKNLLQENRTTRIYETCTDRRNNSIPPPPRSKLFF